MPFDFDHVPDRRATNSWKWTSYAEDVLPMWVADMDFPAPRPILDALHIAVEHGVFGYEFPSKTLRKTVAARMHKLYNWEVDERAVFATSGVVSAFDAAANTLCQPGDGYLIQPPVYNPFIEIQKKYGFIRQEAPLTKVAQNGILHYAVDWDGFAKAFNTGGSKTRMFLLCSPHNPTGKIFTRAELTRMAELCLQNDAVIVSDEIHSELLLGDSTFTPLAALSPEIAQKTITLIAPSKTFNTAGLFCGFAIIPDPQLRKRFRQTTERMSQHVSSLGLIAAQAAFSGACDDWMMELRAYLTANRDVVTDYVTENFPRIRTTSPAATYLSWFDCTGLQLESPQKFFLERAKVALNDGVVFGTGGDKFVRFNFGAPRALVIEALEHMKAALDSLS